MGWEYLRNNTADTNDYFFNQNNASLRESGSPTIPQTPLHWNQYGLTIGGPIIKDKLFFFGSYQGSHFNYSNISTVTEESPEWRAAVAKADAATGVNSVAGLLYKNFQPSVGGSLSATVDQYITTVTPSDTGLASYADYLCPDTFSSSKGFGVPLAQAKIMAARFQSIMGVIPAIDNTTKLTFTGAPCSTPMVSQAGFINRDASSPTGASAMPFQVSGISLVKAQTGAFGNVANLFNGKEWSIRLDYDPSTANRFSANFNYSRTTDTYGPCGDPACARGFYNPEIIRSPNGQFSFLHTFSPKILNEFRAGYSQNASPLLNVAQGGVPSVGFDDGSSGFGSYSGYPQFFKENVYSYSEMVSIGHGNHNMKIGADVRRNIENSQFNIARPSYYFSDPLFFAADTPYGMAAGVNPGVCAPPCSQSTIQGLVSSNTIPNSSLASNFRHWRNIEFGAYFQDDWKATKRMTFSLACAMTSMPVIQRKTIWLLRSNWVREVTRFWG